MGYKGRQCVIAFIRCFITRSLKPQVIVRSFTTWLGKKKKKIKRKQPNSKSFLSANDWLKYGLITITWALKTSVSSMSPSPHVCLHVFCYFSRLVIISLHTWIITWFTSFFRVSDPSAAIRLSPPLFLTCCFRAWRAEVLLLLRTTTPKPD